MTLPKHRRHGVACRLAAVLAAVIAVTACGGPRQASSTGSSSAPPSLVASAGSAAPTRSPDAELTPVPGAATPSPIEPNGTPTQTDTDWGRIWDAVPNSFPRPGQSRPADSIAGPVSAAFSVGAAPTVVLATMKTGLDRAGYATDQSGPLEDGSVVLDSTGASPACRVQTTITPLSGTTLLTILYGAGCPFE